MTDTTLVLARILGGYMLIMGVGLLSTAAWRSISWSG